MPRLKALDRFEQYLNGNADQPVGVAVSGGGDSVALLYLLAEWKRRPLEVFCVDHGLNPHSPEWTQSVARHAAAVGAGFTALRWTGDKPSTGLSAAARTARHALLAEAARQKGVRVLCLAHTHDDIAEAARMRSEGSNVGAPRLWSPSPAWPEGRGVFLLRPLLDQRREALRDHLRARGVNWIDDPANENAASLRARVRLALQGEDVAPPPDDNSAVDLAGLLIDSETAAVGQITFGADNLATRPRPEALRLLAAAAVSAGGGNRLARHEHTKNPPPLPPLPSPLPPRHDRLEALHDRLASGKPATLSGARLQQTGNRISITREAGDIGRHADPVMTVTAHSEGLWDGRFALISSEPGRILPAKGLRAQLDDADRNGLNALPAAVRPALPVFENGRKMRQLPAFPATGTGLSAHCWVLPRFLAACGAFATERDLQGLYFGGPKGL